MNVKLNPLARQMSTLHTAYFVKPEEKKETYISPKSDTVNISKEGQQSAYDRLEKLADNVAEKLSTITKEDFMKQFKQLQGNNPLEINPYREVDPDGSIARKTYFESYIGQLKDTENTIRNYYSNAYEEAISAPIDSLAFISGKYLCDWSDYFDPSMPEKERQWTHSQIRAMLTDTHIALNDPYALAASGGPKTVSQMDEIAKQAVKNKLDMLLEQHNNA